MEYEGYEVSQDEDGTWRVEIGDKVIGVGYSSQETAQESVDARRRRRLFIGRDPVG